MTHPILVLKEIQNQIARQERVNYPPYNIKYVDDFNTVVEIALAGLSEDDISILLEKQVLTVSYSAKTDAAESKYFHKGISSKSFSRSFTLDVDSVVKGADMNNGLLSIYINKVIPESLKPKQILINNKSNPKFLTEAK
jgi:molecular chaperone IbpA